MSTSHKSSMFRSEYLWIHMDYYDEILTLVAIHLKRVVPSDIIKKNT